MSLSEKQPSTESLMESQIDHKKARYPFSIVWTPLPVVTWIVPFIGHMGIALSSGVIRDFSGPYVVSEDNMAFGKPTKYWQLKPELVSGGTNVWDRAVLEASDHYKSQMHNIFLENCHSHVAMALNLMKYDSSDKWNMVKLAFLMFIKGRYVSFGAWLKTWAPFIVIIAVVIVLSLLKGSY